MGSHGVAIGALLGSLLAAVPVAAREIVIANESISAPSISAGDLERVFLGKSTKIRGDRVEIAVLSEGVTHAEFLTSYLHKNPRQFLSHWRKMCFTGKGSMPVSFASERELAAYVRATPGAIGYIDSGTPHAAVKTLAVSP